MKAKYKCEPAIASREIVWLATNLLTGRGYGPKDIVARLNSALFLGFIRESSMVALVDKHAWTTVRGSIVCGASLSDSCEQTPPANPYTHHSRTSVQE